MIRFNVFASAVLAAGLLAAGCHKKEISTTDRKEADLAFHDATFAMSIKDYARGEDGFKKAAALCPDNGDYLLNLGIAEVKLGKKGDAKGAYKDALAAYQDFYKKDIKNLPAAQQSIFVLLLLHRNDDAKAFLDQLIKDHPETPAFTQFKNAGGIDKLADQPQVKDLSL